MRYSRPWFRAVIQSAVLAGVAGCAHTSAPLKNQGVRVAPTLPISVTRLPIPTSDAVAQRGPKGQGQANADRASLAISPVSFDEEKAVSDSASPVKPVSAANIIPLDLAGALTLADEQNPQVAFARERINEAYAQWQRANVLWLPSLRAGVNYNKHEGQIQDVAGQVFTTSRGSFYTGLGAQAVGAGSPAVPGVYANFHVTDAIFQPRIAERVAGAREAAAEANTNDILLLTATAYLEVLRTAQDRSIAEEAAANTKRLVALTSAFAKSGQGLRADDDRARVELALRENEIHRADEAVRVASARLTQLLRLDPTAAILPQEPLVVPLSLAPTDVPVNELVAQGLSHRPEVAEHQHLVQEAVTRLRREQVAPLVPSVLLGLSYGGLGGGKGSNIDNFGDRFDGDAVAFWELRNFGFGERAARCEAWSRVEQARWRQIDALDRVAREVVEANAQVESRRRQIASAESSIKLATDALDRTLLRIQNAEGLPLEALQSIQALATARREYLRAVIEYNVAQFQLLRATGGSIHSAAS